MDRRRTALRFLGIVIVLGMFVALATRAARRGRWSAARATATTATTATTAHASCTKPISVYLVGDSTMSVYPSERAPRMGWGQALGELFAPDCATVKDMAISGRSAKSFYEEGAWNPVKDALED